MKKDAIIVIILMAAGFTGSLSQNLLTSALPRIILDLNVDLILGQWLTTIYIFVLGIITAISAYLFNRFSTKKIFLIALLTFIIGCTIAFVSLNFYVLLFTRIIQAIGAGILIPVLQMSVVYIFPKEKQGQAIGLTGVIVGFAPAVGPTLSGIIVDQYGWRSIFLVLISLSTLIFVLGLLFMRDIGERKQSQLDFKSLSLYTFGFFSLTMAVSYMKNYSDSIMTISVYLLIGILCLTSFVKRQLKHPNPMLKLDLLKNSALVISVFTLSITYITMLAGTVLMPIYIQLIRNFTATTSGLILLPGSLLIAIFSTISGKLVDQFGAFKITLYGMAILLIGNIPFIFFSEATLLSSIVVWFMVRCIGIALLITSCTALGVQNVPTAEKAQALAIQNSLRQLSGSLFTSITVVIASIFSFSNVVNLYGFSSAFVFLTILCTCGLLMTLIYHFKMVR